MGQFDKMFLSGTNLEAVWNQIKKNFYPTSPDNTGPVAIRFTKDSNGIVTGITTSIDAGDISNSMLANSTITINGNAIALGDSVALNTFIGYLSPNANNGVVQLSSGKIPLSVFPDAILGQVLYGGTVSSYVDTTKVGVTMSVSAKRLIESKKGWTSGTLDGKTIRVTTASSSSQSGTTYTFSYADLEGIYFIWASGAIESGEVAREWDGKRFEVGDWLISDGNGWNKIDNTDAVTSVNGDTGAVVVPLNTAGANQSTSQLYLVGAEAQTTGTDGAQTYSNSKVYIKSSHLYSNNKQVVNLSDTQALTNKTYNGLTLTKATTGFTIAGGTTSKTLTVTENTTLNGVYDQESAHAAGTTGTGVVTERALYYALPTINNAHDYTSSSTIYAPTAGGTQGYVLIGKGTAAAPDWTSILFVDETHSRVGIGTTSPSEKLSVSGTFRVTGASTLASTLDVTGATTLSNTLTVNGVATFKSNVRLPYATALQVLDSFSGGNYRNVLEFNSNQRLVLGLGTAAQGYDTFIAGKNVVIQTGTTPTTEATFSTTGLSVVHDIKSTTGDIFALAGGVAAYGITDLDMESGGGSGDVTSIQFGSAEQIDSEDGLLVVPVGQGTSNGTVSIGGADVPVKGLGSLSFLNAVPIATSSVIGGIKIGFTTDATNRNYAVALSSEKAYVNVPWTDTKVTSAANHYTPAAVEYTPTAGSWTWGSTQVVTGITKDGKGHIVGVTTTSIANPNSNTWRNIYVDGSSKVTTATNTKAVNYKAGTNLSVSFQAAGTDSGSADYFNVVFSHATSGATAGSYGDSAAQTPAFGGTFKVPYVTIDAQGHVTGISAHNVTIPATVATDSALGLVKVGSTLAISSGVLNQKSGIVTAGTYRSVTVDTYGRVTAGSNPTTIAGYGITDAKLEHANGTAGTNTAHKITLGDKVLYIYFNSVETTDTDGNKLESFDITVSDNATPSASGANTKTFSFATMTKAQIETICTL